MLAVVSEVLVLREADPEEGEGGEVGHGLP
jgi:hypothetical protein